MNALKPTRKIGGRVNDDPEKEMRKMAQIAMTTPSGNGEAPLPRRLPRGLLPGTWTGRSARIEYLDAAGEAVTTSGCILDLFGFGPVMQSVEGDKFALSWDRIVTVELAGD